MIEGEDDDGQITVRKRYERDWVSIVFSADGKVVTAVGKRFGKTFLVKSSLKTLPTLS